MLDVALGRHEDERLANQVLWHANAYELIDELALTDMAADRDTALDLRLHAVEFSALLVGEHHAVHHACDQEPLECQ